MIQVVGVLKNLWQREERKENTQNNRTHLSSSSGDKVTIKQLDMIISFMLMMRINSFCICKFRVNVVPGEWSSFFLAYRVEHQKLKQTTAELRFGWIFGVQFDLRQTNALISTTNYFTIVQLLDNGFAISSNQCLCLPKAELNTKNSTKRQLRCRLVEFWCSTRFTGKKVTRLALKTV